MLQQRLIYCVQVGEAFQVENRGEEDFKLLRKLYTPLLIIFLKPISFYEYDVFFIIETTIRKYNLESLVLPP